MKIQFLLHEKQIFFSQQRARDQFGRGKREIMQRFNAKSGGTECVGFPVECKRRHVIHISKLKICGLAGKHCCE
jgi:hypothetical protein